MSKLRTNEYEIEYSIYLKFQLKGGRADDLMLFVLCAKIHLNEELKKIPELEFHFLKWPVSPKFYAFQKCTRIVFRDMVTN